MSKKILVGLSFILLPHASLAMEDDATINHGAQRRHTGKTLLSSHASNPSSLPLTIAEENFLLGLKCLREDKFDKSIEYFKIAAEESCDAAEYNLGVIYEYGVSEEIQSDLEKADYWYDRAKNNGHPKAKEALQRVIENKKSSWSFFW